MPQRALKLKQASAVLKVEPKELQNLVQFGVVKPKWVDGAYLFDRETLLTAKVAFRLKESLGTRANVLSRLIDVFRASEKRLRSENRSTWSLLAAFPRGGADQAGSSISIARGANRTGHEQSRTLSRPAARAEARRMEEGVPRSAFRCGQGYRGDFRRGDPTHDSQLSRGKARAGDHRCSRSLKSESNAPWWTQTLCVAGISGFRDQYIRGRIPSADLLHRWAEEEHFVWLYSEDILAEYKEVLKRLHVRSAAIGTLINIIREQENLSRFARLTKYRPTPRTMHSVSVPRRDGQTSSSHSTRGTSRRAG